MQHAKHVNPVVHLGGDARTRSVVASNRLMALWRTVTGKKVVMAVTGLVFHLLHLTGGVVRFGAGQFKDLAVYQNVVAAFAVWPVALFYIVAMGALCLHLSHGIWSMLQTLGWNTARNETTLKIISRVIAIAVFAGFTSVPVAVMAGWLR